MNKRLIAIRGHRYPPMTSRAIGDEYDATDGDAVVLVAANLAKYVEKVNIETRPAQYETKEQKAEPLAKEQPVQRKHQYKRKDLTPA